MHASRRSQDGDFNVILASILTTVENDLLDTRRLEQIVYRREGGIEALSREIDTAADCPALYRSYHVTVISTLGKHLLEQFKPTAAI